MVLTGEKEFVLPDLSEILIQFSNVNKDEIMIKHKNFL